MKKKFSILLVLICTLALAMTACGEEEGRRRKRDTSKDSVTKSSVPFEQIKLDKIGNHTYIDETYFDRVYVDKSTKKEILKILKEADESIDFDIYFTGYGNSMADGSLRVNGYFCKEGAIVVDLLYEAIEGRDGTYQWYGLNDTPYRLNINSSDIIPVASVFDTVYNLAEDNKDKIFENTNEEPITGTYGLYYNEFDGLYYEFKINEYSCIKVNAYTGDVINEYYWDGVYVD